MMKRVTWFVAGAAAGVAGGQYATRKARRAADRLKPANVARSAAGRVRTRVADVADAVREGRDAMRAKEAELRAAREGERTVTVEPGQVIVLREVREVRDVRDARDAGAIEPAIAAHPAGSGRTRPARRRRSRAR